MKILNEEDIVMLISCEKIVTEAPKKNMQLKNRSFRNDMKLRSVNNEYIFSVFIRYSEDFPEDFSIGLIYESETGKKHLLYRCNGPHGESLDQDFNNETHFGYHEHIVIPETNKMKSKITTSFGTYQDAIEYFCNKCKIINAIDFFPFLNNNNQLNLDLR